MERRESHTGDRSPAGGAVRVFILDRHEVVRLGLRGLLEGAGMTVVGEAGSVRDSLAQVPQLEPHVAVLGTQLADGIGIEVCRRLRSAAPGVQCIILNDAHDDQAVLEAVLAGAAGYFPKDTPAATLVEAIGRAAAGETLFGPGAEARAKARLSSAEPKDPLVESLTPQEHRVLDLIAEGLTNRQIARELDLAEKTAKNYVSSVLTKLGLRHRTQAALHVATRNEDGRNGDGRNGDGHPGGPSRGR
ncbi:LuxR family transcriptional regulator [Sinomonas atrocyanea]|uniref:LuxR family transcriptional regulator n=1 Tax=Sinomonas atrocyanea TaxID=37927 RepID=A0A127A4A5_9MICC|nr:response regulator transcription factor [Sinomonas atrocyanea]AMM33926.1 LuxR family transcriptional regulator [Sinomonas atrocyanea]GEB63454.1 DNA-binding response regulator [Sinomonas atrocyanea]